MGCSACRCHTLVSPMQLISYPDGSVQLVVSTPSHSVRVWECTPVDIPAVTAYVPIRDGHVQVKNVLGLEGTKVITYTVGRHPTHGVALIKKDEIGLLAYVIATSIHTRSNSELLMIAKECNLHELPGTKKTRHGIIDAIMRQAGNTPADISAVLAKLKAPTRSQLDPSKVLIKEQLGEMAGLVDQAELAAYAMGDEPSSERPALFGSDSDSSDGDAGVPCPGSLLPPPTKEPNATHVNSEKLCESNLPPGCSMRINLNYGKTRIEGYLPPGCYFANGEESVSRQYHTDATDDAILENIRGRYGNTVIMRRRAESLVAMEMRKWYSQAEGPCHPPTLNMGSSGAGASPIHSVLIFLQLVMGGRWEGSVAGRAGLGFGEW